jgi:tight adherence protein C
MQSSFLLLAQSDVWIPPVSGLGRLAVIAWTLSALLAGGYMGSQLMQIRYATLADGQRARRKLPLSFSLLLPFTVNVKRFHRTKYQRLRAETETQLVAAGYDTVLSPVEFLALRLLVPLVMGTGSVLLLYLLFTRMPGGIGAGMRERQGLLFAALVLYFVMSPKLWLKRTIRERHRQFDRALPFVLDLLTLSVEAGMDFMSSIRRIIERRKVDALSEEFIRATREMQIGRTRREALKDMAKRTQHPDLTSVVSALCQADELGVGMGTILRIQADQIRQRRFQRAEKLANEAPVKLLFPLVCFIFPSVFLVLLGPILLEMLSTGVF